MTLAVKKGESKSEMHTKACALSTNFMNVMTHKRACVKMQINSGRVEAVNENRASIKPLSRKFAVSWRQGQPCSHQRTVN